MTRNSAKFGGPSASEIKKDTQEEQISHIQDYRQICITVGYKTWTTKNAFGNGADQVISILVKLRNLRWTSMIMMVTSLYVKSNWQTVKN